MKHNNMGFTLMEMLIVVAIIAILIAVAIPAFIAIPEKTGETADVSNIRSAYAQIISDGMTGIIDEPTEITENIDYEYSDGQYIAVVSAKQTDGKDWIISKRSSKINIGIFEDVESTASPGGWKLIYNYNTGKVTIEVVS